MSALTVSEKGGSNVHETSVIELGSERQFTSKRNY